MARKDTPITWPSLVTYAPLAVIIATVVLGYAATSAKVDSALINTTAVSLRLDRLDDKLEKVKDDQNVMKVDLAEIKQALRANDLLAKKNTGSSNLAAASTTPEPAPTPSSSPPQLASSQTAGPSATTETTTTEEEKKREEQTDQPTQNSVQEIVNNVLSLLL